jgi:hypothetical protein
MLDFAIASELATPVGSAASAIAATTAGGPLLAVFSPAAALGTAAAAIAVPLLIHLLFRKRYQIVPWAAVRFLLTAERRHRRRIDQWLLLALRVFALLLPLAAMAAATEWAESWWQQIQPGKLETVSTMPRTHHVLVLDGSLSMNARTSGGQTRFEKGIAAAEDLVRKSSPGDGFTVVFLDGPPRTIVPGPSNVQDRVLKEIQELKPSHAAADTAAVLSIVSDSLARSPREYARRQVTFFTDLQRSAWANALPRPDETIPEAWAQILKGKDGRKSADVAVVDLAGADVENLAVANLELGDALALLDTPATVTATIQNHGSTERRLVRLELLLGRPSASGTESLVSVETRVIDAIPAHGSASATFSLEGSRTGFRTRGIHVVQVRLMDGDDLPMDDARSLAVEVREGIHAMIVDGRKGESDPLRRAGEHLSRALVPPGATAAETPARLHRPGSQWPATADDRWVLSPMEFADPAVGDPAGAECIFLCDVGLLTPAIVAKLEAHLKRGGGVVIGLGPNAAAAKEAYNRLLYNDGNGILPGPLIEVAASPPDDPGFRLGGDEEAFRRAPLAAFRDDNARAGLVTVPFRAYVKMDAPADGRARRLLSFVPAAAPADAPGAVRKRPDPGIVEWSRHRGRVMVYTSSFNQDWTDWPVLPSFLPFAHEVLRFAAANPDRHTLNVGDTLEEYFPASTAGLTAGLNGPNGLTAPSLLVSLRDEAGVVSFSNTRLSGIYYLGIGSARDRIFAVNPAESIPAGGSEFDLSRAGMPEFKAVGPVQVVSDPSEVKPADGASFSVTRPRPHGPTIARWVVLAALAVVVAEALLAWRFGPARTPGAGGKVVRPPDRRPVLRWLGTFVALAPLALGLAVVLIVLRADQTGNLFGFLPQAWEHSAESAVAWAAGLQAPPAGENNRLALERSAAIAADLATDWWIAAGLALGIIAIAISTYRLERTAAGGTRRVLVPGLLRIVAVLIVVFLLLSQWQLAFKREGWPEIVILLDTSASMSVSDDLKDPAVRAKAEQLAGAIDLPRTHRLRLAQLLLTKPGASWLDRLLHEKRVKVHIHAVDRGPRLIAAGAEESDAASIRDALMTLRPEGDQSRLGEGLEAVVKSYQGGSLAGVILFTDGVTTGGINLVQAAENTSVPLYLVGMGDPWVVPDLRLSDPVFEEIVARGDTLDLRARVTARGAVPPDPVPVTLYEKDGAKRVEQARVMVTPSPSGAAVKVPYTPTELGEKTLVLEVPAMPGEAEIANNRIERRILVVEAKRARVLFVEGDPRYEFRFAKALMERESELVAGNKSIEFKTLVLHAARGWSDTDKSALADFPTREQLFEYDVVILGDFDPKQLPRWSRAMQDLADFVKIRGGGLLFLAGEHHGPSVFADTPLGDVLPVIPVEDAKPQPTPENQPIAEGYRPSLTHTGRSHPLFRFSPDAGESARIWARLQPLYWFAKGYRRKPAAEVLAVHPSRAAEGVSRENHPLVLQQFVGAGRVLFFGFDETWRWRWRADEEQFNRFWTQVVRVLARARRGRIEMKLEPGGGPYRRDDRISIKVRFPDDAPTPPEGTTVRVQIKRTPLPNPDGSMGPGDLESREIILHRVKSERAEFEETITRTPEGRYQFTLVEPSPGPVGPQVEATVLPPPDERENVDMNRADLTAAAELAHVRFYTLASADKVFDDLHDLEPIPLNEPRPPLPLWNQPLIFALLLSLFAAEWLLRKREGLL